MSVYSCCDNARQEGRIVTHTIALYKESPGGGKDSKLFFDFLEIAGRYQPLGFS